MYKEALYKYFSLHSQLFQAAEIYKKSQHDKLENIELLDGGLVKISLLSDCSNQEYSYSIRVEDFGDIDRLSDYTPEVQLSMFIDAEVKKTKITPIIE